MDDELERGTDFTDENACLRAKLANTDFQQIMMNMMKVMLQDKDTSPKGC